MSIFYWTPHYLNEFQMEPLHAWALRPLLHAAWQRISSHLYRDNRQPHHAQLRDEHRRQGLQVLQVRYGDPLGTCQHLQQAETTGI